MKPIEGYTVTEQTDDKIVQELRFGENGHIEIVGNPNPDPAERQKLIDEVAKILLLGYQRSLAKEKEVGA